MSTKQERRDDLYKAHQVRLIADVLTRADWLAEVRKHAPGAANTLIVEVRRTAADVAAMLQESATFFETRGTN